MPAFAPSGEPIFARGVSALGDGRYVANREIAANDWHVCTAPTPTGPWTSVAPRGAHILTAGNGRWLGFLVGTGVFDEQAVLWPRASLGADIQAGRGVAAPDGTIAIVLDYQEGKGLGLYRPSDGSTFYVMNARPFGQVAVVDKTQAAWWDVGTGRVETCGGLPRPLTLPGVIGWLSMLFLGGAWWVTYNSPDDRVGMVLHPHDSFLGYRVALPPAYYQTAMVMGPNTALLAYATDPADSAGRVSLIDVSREPRLDLLVPPAKADPPTHPDPPKDPPKEPPVSLPDPQAVKAALDVERRKYPSLASDDQMVTMLNAAAIQFPYMGLHKKTGHGLQPVTGIPCSRQILRWMPRGDPLGYWSDVVGGAGRDTPPQAVPLAPEWKRSSDGAETFVIAVTTSEGPPAPPPPPLPPDRELARLRAENVALRVANAELADAIVALKTLPPAAAHPSYSQNMDLAIGADAAYQAAQRPRGRGHARVPLYAEAFAHFLWQYLIEARAAADILAEAIQRGSGA